MVGVAGLSRAARAVLIAPTCRGREGVRRQGQVSRLEAEVDRLRGCSTVYDKGIGMGRRGSSLPARKSSGGSQKPVSGRPWSRSKPAGSRSTPSCCPSCHSGSAHVALRGYTYMTLNLSTAITGLEQPPTCPAQAQHAACSMQHAACSMQHLAACSTSCSPLTLLHSYESLVGQCVRMTLVFFVSLCSTRLACLLLCTVECYGHHHPPTTMALTGSCSSM